MNLIIYEDNCTKQLKPFSINHASFEIRIGNFSLLERIIKSFEKKNNLDQIVLIVRKKIELIIKEKFPEYEVNPDIIPSGKCINGSLFVNDQTVNCIYENQSMSNGKLISFYLESEISKNSFYEKVSSEELVSTIVKIKSINYLWDSIEMIEQIIFGDIHHIKKQNEFTMHTSCIVENIENIYFGKQCVIKAGVILDASKGPIIISDKVTIGSGSIIEGPVYIGKYTEISIGAKIRGNVSIGVMCKVGGEVSNSIFQAFSNKAHEGFLGHSFIGEWVNICAGTNNSNLKNNYNNISIDLGYEEIETNCQFLGTLIGDYSKLGISSIINTGSYIGLASNILGGKLISKHIPSFYWSDEDKVDLEKLFLSINKMKNRRNNKITEIEKDFLKNIY